MRISAQIQVRKELQRCAFWAGMVLDSYLSTHLNGSDGTDFPGLICGADRDRYDPAAFSSENFCTSDNEGTDQTQEEYFIDNMDLSSVNEVSSTIFRCENSTRCLHGGW